MSLLTEEQLEQIRKAHAEWMRGKEETSYSEILYSWNEKQTGLQVNVNWSRAPNSAIGASIDVTWLNENGFNTLGYHLAKYDRPPKPVTPHPHAELIMKYAEVAQRRADPWKEFEYKSDYAINWIKFSSEFCFAAHCKYRYIGDGK
jgi:hypothetical protein